MSVKLPRAVQAQSDRFDEVVRQATEAGNPPDTKSPTPPADAPPPAPPSHSAADTPPPAPPQEPKPEDRQDWKSKYMALQGKYNAEVPRLHQDLKEAKARISDLETKLTDALKAPPASPKQSPNVEAVRAKFGDEMADAVRALAEEAAAEVRAELSPLKEQVGQTVERVEAVQSSHAQSEEAAFVASLELRVPGWREIDVKPEWHAFLAKRDPFTGRELQELLVEAYTARQVDRVAHFFDAFKAATAQPPATPPPSAPPANPLEAQLVPDIAGSRAAPATEKKTWTTAEIKQFYKDKALGKYPANRAAEIETDINAAAAEGRVRR